jgi:hypothetical protein
MPPELASTGLGIGAVMESLTAWTLWDNDFTLVRPRGSTICKLNVEKLLFFQFETKTILKEKSHFVENFLMSVPQTYQTRSTIFQCDEVFPDHLHRITRPLLC